MKNMKAAARTLKKGKREERAFSGGFRRICKASWFCHGGNLNVLPRHPLPVMIDLAAGECNRLGNPSTPTEISAWRQDNFQRIREGKFF